MYINYMAPLLTQTFIYSAALYKHHIVTNLKVVNTTTSSAAITWDQLPHNYRVFLHGEATDNIPQSRVIQLVNVTGQTTHTVEGLDSFRNYSISVFLASDNGIGTDATVIVNTTGRGKGGCSYRLCMKDTACKLNYFKNSISIYLERVLVFTSNLI